MMDAKEARDLLILESAGAARNRKRIQANAMAILALERRIPKKPSGDYHSVPELWSAHRRAAISRARSRNRLAGIGTQRTLCGIQGEEI